MAFGKLSLSQLITLVLFLSTIVHAAHSQQHSFTGSVTPAATVASIDSSAGVPLFRFEAVQLTDPVITELVNSKDQQIADYAYLFAFDNSSAVTPAARARTRHARLTTRYKTYPGDIWWPSELVWGIFDFVLGGALEPIIPLASPCYKDSVYSNYDAAKCANITSAWGIEKTHYEHPGSVFYPVYEGKTFLQGTDPISLENCTQGGYSLYSVKITNVAQIQLAVNFARTLNLRLVVINTGHGYNRRSTGKDAVSIWTYNLKDIIYVPNYKGPSYSGSAMKIGAGVQGFELYEAADKYGVSAVSGICPSVGVAGGYTTGGGHSPLMQLHGMGADQVVALEVVTAAGFFVTATPTINADLYWALLGGGGGTFGIITSAVVKVHPRVAVTTSVFNFTTSTTVSNETFWKGVRAFWDEMPTYNKAKTYSYFFISLTKGVYTFEMFPFFATQKTIAEYEALHFDTFYPAYKATFGTIDYHVGGYTSIPGNRILPATNWEDAALNAQTFDALKHAVDNSLRIGLYHQVPVNSAENINSVNLAFRNEAGMLIAINPVAANATPTQLEAVSLHLTNVVLGHLRDVTPHGGAYGNEADVAEPNWQQAFWGTNYAKLLAIKKKWDPMDLFYVHHGVGSEMWVVEDGNKGVQTQDGKLCRA